MDEVLSHPASRAQQRLWFVEQLVPGEPVHNISFEGRFDGRLDEAVLRTAVADAVARHESLRTKLESRENELWQVVLAPPDEPPLTFVDLADAPAEAYQELCDRLGKEVFDLGTAPLLRMAHVRLAEVDALVIVVHHAVADAVSADILVGDLIVAYNARLDGNPPDWPELPVQYADFTAWQEDQASGPAAQQDLAYWREQLADVSTLDLTHGRPRPARLSQRGKRIEVALDPETGAALDAFVRGEHATAFMGVLAAYVAALGRVFGADDVAVSSTVAGRPLPEVQQVVGMFVDRVVLRLDLSSGPTFRDLVRTARRVVAQAHDHSSITFDQVVEAVAPEREMGVTPLAQAAINLQPPAAGREGRAGRMPRMTTGSLIDTGVVGHDLSIDLVSDGGYTGTVRYRSDIVSDDAAQRVATLFTRFVRDGLADPDRPLWTIGTEDVPAVEPAPTGGPELLHSMIAQWAERSPDAPALVWAGGSLSFAEYVAAANRLAHELRAHGVEPEVPVLVAADRSPELFVGMFAVLTAGGTYVPVDPAAPAAHLATVVAQTGATLALGPVPGSITTLPLSLDTGADPGPPDVVVRPANAAYILFTSGSTGVPKGVVVEHRNVVAYLRSLHTLVPGPASHLTLQPATFDSSMTSSLGALAGGGALHIVDDDTARDPVALAAFLATHPVDYYKITPSHLSALGADDGLRPRKAVILGGEAAGEALTGRLLDAGWGVIVHYGPTETTIGVCAAKLDGATGAALGRPLPGAAVYLLDRWGRPVPPGCRGEVYVGGPQVTRGYLGGADVRYLPDPFHTFHSGRMYRTGDLARRLPDGTLVFCGRADRQVKVRGFRVEPGSVEAALESHPSVRASAVVLRDSRLVAYVTPADVSPSALAEFAATLLPAHAVPAEIVALAELPMTRHGKLDLAALPSPSASVSDEQPATPVEAELLACWQAAMPGRDFGVTDAFFDVGGDSIRAIHVVAEAQRRNLSLTLRQLFALRTIRALAGVVSVEQPGTAPLGLTGPTALRVPPDASVTTRPGVTVAGSTVTLDPALVPDDAVGDLISADGAVADAPGVLIPPSTVDALVAGAHEAYATTTHDLVVAAAVRALGPVAVPGGVVRVASGCDDEDLIRSVKTALRAPAEDDPTLPAVRFLAVPPSVAVTDPGVSDRLIVMVAGARVLGPDDVAARVRDHLVELVDHCLSADTTYHVTDFPDSGLDDAAMARLLSGLDADSEVAP
ncbi:non-ribosomal peptide synthetase [Labedaea rhizosphaerae]|uniref:Amino acid adenylation domain-containing protein n=1 Tax=Labedaea rhizosphaerae TaxID=598644 RepID=A0A4R6S6A0_LABRH|nr:non-ribosomal peptide synthetase [Labedaea rhizosphaerae]TDP95211.1 amino acid adenylation domain-containing protein [Labedaea rhizosphaerae]